MEAKGVLGQLELLETKIRIKRKGLLNWGKGDKEILIKQISSIQFRKAGMLTNGYIQFAFIGGQEAKGGFFQAAQDENTIMFKRGQQSAFEKMKEAIEKKIASMKDWETKPSNLDELEKLAALRDKGIISEEEFKAKKKQLLGL